MRENGDTHDHGADYEHYRIQQDGRSASPLISQTHRQFARHKSASKVTRHDERPDNIVEELRYGLALGREGYAGDGHGGSNGGYWRVDARSACTLREGREQG